MKLNLSKKKKPIFAFFVFLLFTFVFLAKANPASAYETSGDPCKTTKECQELLGMEEAKCLNGYCGITTKDLDKLLGRNWLDPSLGSFQEKVEEAIPEVGEDPSLSKIGGESYGFWWVKNLFNSVTSTAYWSPSSPEENTGGQVSLPGGALGETTKLIGLLYAHPPASGVEYLADLGQNLGIVTPAYAQGFGFNSLAPLLKIWKVFRDIAYLCFVFVFVVIGLAIMFRIKLSPQTVLTLENALPKMVMALILVTFSYAIAGFLIDLIYVLIGLSVAILEQNGLLSLSANSFYTAGPGALINMYLGEGGGRSFVGRIGSAIEISKLLPAGGVKNTLDAILKLPAWTTLIPGIGGVVGATKSLNAMPGAALSMILVLALCFAMFKLLFSLLMTYVNIIISVITAPLIIMFSAIPGQEKNTFETWLKNLVSNILVFPAVIGLFLLSQVIFKVTTEGGKMWSPPFLFTSDASMVGAMISFAMLMLAPKVPDYVKVLFDPKAKAPSPGATIFAPIGGAIGVPKTIVGAPAGIIKGGFEKKVENVIGAMPPKGMREKGLLGTFISMYQNPHYTEEAGIRIKAKAAGLTVDEYEAKQQGKVAENIAKALASALPTAGTAPKPAAPATPPPAVTPPVSGTTTPTVPPKPAASATPPPAKGTTK